MIAVEKVASRHGRKPLPRRTLKTLLGLLGFGVMAASVTLLVVTRHSRTRPTGVPQIEKAALRSIPNAEENGGHVETKAQSVENTDVYDDNGFPKNYQKIELSNWPSLRAYHHVNLITKREADHIIGLAEPYLLRSRVVGDNSGEKNVVSEVRTSQGMFLISEEHRKDPVVVAFRERLSKATGLPVKNMEGTQVLRYDGGGYYKAHPDYFSFDYNELLKRGGQRMVTVLCYLNTPARGGDTRFPRVNITVPAVTGNCVEFYSLNEKRQPDEHSWHEALPTEPGVTKWSMPTWIREYEFH